MSFSEGEQKEKKDNYDDDDDCDDAQLSSRPLIKRTQNYTVDGMAC